MSTFTVLQVSQMVGVTYGTVMNWINSGKLQAESGNRGLRKVWIIHEKALEAFCIKYNVHQVPGVPPLSIQTVQQALEGYHRIMNPTTPESKE